MANDIEIENTSSVQGTTQGAPAKAERSTDDKSGPEQRAKRLKSLRQMTGLSRDVFRQRYGIARGTLQNWESARFGGLTLKGAVSMIRAFKAENVEVSVDWLMHGVGRGPHFASLDNQQVDASNKEAMAGELGQEVEKELSIITEELLCFRRLNPDSIDLVMTDDSMTPFYAAGDYVAGVRRYQGRIESAVGHDCIVQTTEYGTLLRRLAPGEEPDRYTLLAHNVHTRSRRPVLYNVDVISAAPVIWVRRVEDLSD